MRAKAVNCKTIICEDIMNDKEDTIAEAFGDAAIDETEDKKALTRSIHIIALGIEVTVTSQDESENLEIIQGIVEKMINRYSKKSDGSSYS